MLVKFYDRTPGGHTHLGDARMDAIPREGDAAVYNDEPKTVHSVTWNLTEMSVSILLK